ncbi:condensin-2 complex subunit D3-like isoform X2 [Scylla paramamosain]|uniref:condensin-2 complex subunit D3-like isoform X2 n=1 Tax=Scylla paramamosain TaxID=85552 RepID=UPI003083117A
MITNKLVVKQNVIEIIVPILIAVKHKPEEQRSPLMKHLLLYLKELMKDYKNEVVKQNVIEIIVPILIAVKHKPEEQRSPLMKHLLLYLKELMKDYKNEAPTLPWCEQGHVLQLQKVSLLEHPTL